MEAKFKAVALAHKVVQMSEQYNGRTQLQLQKIMYYIQGSFMAKLGIKAFSEDLEAWPYGPVVKEVWKEFSCYGRDKIPVLPCNIILAEQEKELIDSVLTKCLTMNVWTLVDKTHQELPWKRAHDQGSSFISDKDMIEQFCTI